MGAHLVRRYITETDTEPDPAKKYEFDPEFGFPERKERGLSAVPTSWKRLTSCYCVFTIIWIGHYFLISHASTACQALAELALCYGSSNTLVCAAAKWC